MRIRQGVQRGAAMVELIVAAIFFLLPLYLAIQAMGKFSDVRYTAHSAARYLAWERTVWFSEVASDFNSKNEPNFKADAAIKNEIAVRVMNDRHSTLKYKSDDRNATAFANGVDPLWEDTAGAPYLKRYDQLAGSTSDSRPSKDLLGGAIRVVNAVSIPHVTGELAPPVPTETLASGLFQLSGVARESEAYKRLWSKKQGLPDDWVGLDVQSQSGILSNTWAANSSVGTKAMVKESVPTANALGSAVETAVKVVLMPWDPLAISRLDMGKIGVDVVPPDRLR